MLGTRRAMGFPCPGRWGLLAALAAWLDARYRLDHAGFRRDRPSVLRGSAAGAASAARRSSSWFAGIWRSDRSCFVLGLLACGLAEPARPPLAGHFRGGLCDSRSDLDLRQQSAAGTR